MADHNAAPPEGTQTNQANASPPPDEDDALGQRLSEVYHDLNNSLAVISGNAQLLSEMARTEGLGTSFTDPLEDVEAARMEISKALERLDRLRREAASETAPSET